MRVFSDSFKYCRKPEWMKEGAAEAIKDFNVEDLKYVFEIFEVFRINGSIESFVRPKYK